MNTSNWGAKVGPFPSVRKPTSSGYPVTDLGVIPANMGVDSGKQVAGDSDSDDNKKDRRGSGEASAAKDDLLGFKPKRVEDPFKVMRAPQCLYPPRRDP